MVVNTVLYSRSMNIQPLGSLRDVAPVAPRTLIQLLHLAPLPLRGRAPLVGTSLETPERAALSPSAAPRRRRGPERDRAPNKKAVPPEPPQTKPVCVCLSVCLSVRKFAQINTTGVPLGRSHWLPAL